MQLLTMKKAIIFIIVLILIPLVLVSSKIEERFLTKKYIIEEIINEKYIDKDTKISQLLFDLPYKVLRVLYKNNVRIVVIEDINEEGEYGVVVSKYIHKDRKIIIESKYINEVILYHEIGHAYSYNKIPLLKISDLKEFKNIYRTDLDKLFPSNEYMKYDVFNISNNYIRSDTEEYYAQCFAMYFSGVMLEEGETFDYYEEYFNEY